MVIKHRFLVFPIDRKAEETLVTFTVDGRLVYDLNMRLTHGKPDFHAFVDVSRFHGQDVCLAAAEGALPHVAGADDWDERAPFDVQERPLLHFTPRNGWNNDPNGLVYANGTYHMFFQYNPCDVVWGNMHWGHATSSDLIHWQEKEIALFPDELGVMFSGSAIVDERNLLGLKQGDTDVILLFYTAEPVSQLAAGRQTTQCLAYSTDNGCTFVKHPQNPIVPTIVNGNRDPKVLWDEASQRYLMALYLDSDRYAILHSHDLLHWEKVQELHLEGDNECPDLMLLTADDGQRKAVIGGAHGCYQVGDLLDGRFVPTQPVRRLYLNEYCYAHQTYSGTPGRVVQTTWHRANVEGTCFSQELSFPNELTLRRQGNEYQLCILPARELEDIVLCRSNAVLQSYQPGEVLRQAVALPVAVRLQPAGDAELIIRVGDQILQYHPAARTLSTSEETYALPEGAEDDSLLMLLDRYTFKVHLCGGTTLLALPVRWEAAQEIEISAEMPWQLAAFECTQLRSSFEV